MNRIAAILVFCAGALSAPTHVTAAQSAAPAELTAVVHGHPPLAPLPSPIGVSAGAVIIFLDEPLEVSALLQLPRGAEVPGRWWRSVRATVSDGRGAVRIVSGAEAILVEARIAGKLVAGTRTSFRPSDFYTATARFQLGPLPPGDYALRVSAPVDGKDVRSYPAVFHVRRGDEDRAVQRAYLRVQAARTHAWDDYKAVMMKLLELEPDNSGDLEQIADRSLNEAPPEETLAWYRRTRESRQRGIERQRAERGKNLSPEERRAGDELMRNVSVFEKIYPYYREHQHDLQLVILGYSGPEKLYAWRRKSDGGVVGILDRDNPTIVRPIERRTQ
jgi:hypothetical protein